MWLNLFDREYLTQDRRQKMNALVDSMNSAIGSAVQRAGDQVHFVDYDYDVGASHGRFCQPGQAESSGKGANLQDLFFYQMKTNDVPWFDIETPAHTELRRGIDERDEVAPVNDTLGALFGALIMEAIDNSDDDHGTGYAAVEDDNATADLEEEVHDAEQQKRSEAIARPLVVRRSTSAGLHAPYIAWNASAPSPSDSFPSATASRFGFGPTLGSIVYASPRPDPARPVATHASFMALNVTRFAAIASSNNNTTNTTNTTSPARAGTVIANQTHILLGNGQAVQRFKLNPVKLFLPDKLARIFHPTQSGHATIANMVLWYMAFDNARRIGLSFPCHAPTVRR